MSKSMYYDMQSNRPPSGGGRSERSTPVSGQRPIGYWVRTVDRLIDDEFAAAAAEMGLTRRQWQILNVLAEHPGATRAEIARALAPFLGETEPIDQHLAGLADLVTVRPDGLELTPAGRARLDEVYARSVGDLRARVSAGLTQEDYDTTLRTLERIARNLGWSD
jgi:DNA-binding MarR family transcriptional regulator